MIRGEYVADVENDIREIAGWQAEQDSSDKESLQEWAVRGGYVVGQWSKDFATGRVMVDMFEKLPDIN